MSFFLLVGGNIQKIFWFLIFESDANLVLLVKIPPSNILQNATICSWKS